MLNLRKELNAKGISVKDYSAFLGVAEKTARNKLNGQTEFTVNEAIKTASFMFPEYDLKYLFGDNATPDQQNPPTSDGSWMNGGELSEAETKQHRERR